MAARLKVYAATMGFFDTVVAAPNQKAALAAWGVQQDLFADGSARVADDEGAVSAALAEPGVVLRRPLGSTDAYTADAAPRLAAPTGGKRPTAKAKAPARPKPAPDRGRLTAAEAAVAALETERRAAVADLDRRRAELERDAAATERDFAKRAAALERELDKQRGAFRRAGGDA